MADPPPPPRKKHVNMYGAKAAAEVPLVIITEMLLVTIMVTSTRVVRDTGLLLHFGSSLETILQCYNVRSIMTACSSHDRENTTCSSHERVDTVCSSLRAVLKAKSIVASKILIFALFAHKSKSLFVPCCGTCWP
jgi:hypothetical protein